MCESQRAIYVTYVKLVEQKISSMLIKELDGLARLAIKDELNKLDFGGGGGSVFDAE